MVANARSALSSAVSALVVATLTKRGDPYLSLPRNRSQDRKYLQLFVRKTSVFSVGGPASKDSMARVSLKTRVDHPPLLP